MTLTLGEKLDELVEAYERKMEEHDARWEETPAAREEIEEELNRTIMNLHNLKFEVARLLERYGYKFFVLTRR